MAYREMWEVEVVHEGLNKYRHIRGSDKNIVLQKAAAQRLTWDKMWESKQISEKKKMDRETKIRSKEEKKELAKIKTNEAQVAINQLESILLHTLKIDDAIDWNSLLDNKKYSDKKPKKPNQKQVPSEPKEQDTKYQPKLGFFDKLFYKSQERKENEARKKFTVDHRAWAKVKRHIDEKNKEIDSDYVKSIKEWEINKHEYEEKQKVRNKGIEEKKNQYLNKEIDVIPDYCDMVLTNSKYPDYFPQEWDLDYQLDTKILIVDYSLPDFDCLPTDKKLGRKRAEF